MIRKFLNTLIFSAILFQAEAQTLDVKMDEKLISPGDSLYFTATYTPAPGKPAPATLLVMAINDSFRIWEKRFPLLGEPITPSILIPKDMPTGNYRLRFEVMESFFSFTGKLNSPGYVKSLDATLVTRDGEYLQKELAVLPDSTFIFNNVLFPDDALLSFSSKRVNRDRLSISAVQIVDSTEKNVNPVNKDIYIGERNAGNQPVPAVGDTTAMLTYFDQAHMLEAVRVITDTKTTAEKFNNEYSTGLFRTADERLIDMTTASGGYLNVMQYLQGRVAGLNISSFGNATWRGQRVQFYVDEIRSSIDLVETIPVTDIALVKAYPPPFFGNPGGGGGAVAIYTKRGGNFETLGNNTFRVKGYTPLQSAFPVKPTR